MLAPPSHAPPQPSMRPSTLPLKMRKNHLCGTVNLDRIKFSPVNNVAIQYSILQILRHMPLLPEILPSQYMFIKKQDKEMNYIQWLLVHNLSSIRRHDF
jgi:hypothetical protein